MALRKIYPDRTWPNYSLTGWIPEESSIHAALDATLSSYVRQSATYGQQQAWCYVGLPTPTGLTNDYRWVRGRMRMAVRDTFGSSPWSEMTLPEQPTLFVKVNGGFETWNEIPTADTKDKLMGPRALFINGWFRLATHPGSISDVNDLRFEFDDALDYIDPPTASIVGPTGSVAIVGGAYIPAQWTFVPAPMALPYSAWRLQVARNVDGTGVIYQAYAGTPTTTHQIPAYVFSGYIGQPLYVRVQVAHETGDLGFPGAYLGPDSYNQFGPFAQAQFTPTGTITSTYMATRPSSWVDDLSDANRALLTRSHQPTFAAVLYSWDGQKSWPLEIVDGDVTFDASQQVRRTFSLTVANPELRARAGYPMDPTRPLHPFGSYVQLARGVGDELVAICCGVVEQVAADLTVSGEGPVTVAGADWARWFTDARLGGTVVRQSWNGAAWVRDPVTTVLAALANEAGLTSVVNGSSGATVAPNYATARTALRPELADALCAELGWWWWADTYGRIVYEPVPPETGTPRYRFVEGVDCVVIRHTANLDRAEMYDLTVAYDDAGLYVGGAYDANPSSPIARGAAITPTPAVGRGPFAPGGKPFFFAGPLITSTASAQTTARTTLARRAVPAERITIEIIPHPDIAPGHRIEVERVGEVPRPWVVAAGTIPLVPTRAMTLDAYSPITYVTPAN